MQCMKFFDEYPHILLVDGVDTALCAQEIAEKKIAGRAAISSKKAAGHYNLEVIAEGIETHKMNYTRFLILTSRNGNHQEVTAANKSSITFALAHKIGCLSKVLSILSFYNINLAKIQSMPIIGKDWEYQFFVDLEIDDYTLYLQAIEAIRPFTSHLQIFGEYLKGKSVME
jgi:prephenate dehydratase